jgi:hypothetical protein
VSVPPTPQPDRHRFLSIHAKTSYEKNVADARELGDLVAKVGSEAVDILSRRVVASLDEVKAAAGHKATDRTAVVA